MSKTTKIEWTDKTWNPVTGCTKVSAGCTNCYAEIMSCRLRAMGQYKYRNGFELTLHENARLEPLNWKKPHMVFVCSMGDLFHEDVPFDFIDKVLETIRITPHHTYQILTKREQIIQKYFSGRIVPDNVWLGVTVEHEKTKHRIDVLKTIDATIRFVSIEPLIGDVGFLNLSDIHWVIVGGESGVSARPMNPEWAIKIQKQCADQKVAFFFKQWGTWGEDGVKRNKKVNGSSLSGKEWKEEPKVIFPPATTFSTERIRI